MRKVALICVIVAPALWAQTANPPATPSPPLKSPHASTNPKKQLSPDQKFWCSQIASASGQAKALEPAMQSFLLTLIANSLKECDPSRVQTTLISSFTATLGIPDGDASTRSKLQSSALRALVRINEEKVVPLLPQADPYVRAGLLSLMIWHAAEARKFNKAMSLLAQTSPGEGFPYDAATELMLDLPPELEADKQGVFLRAMASDHEQPSVSVPGDDFTEMVIRFWQHIPASVALDAIHQILDESRSDTSQINLGSSSGKIAFKDLYQYRLFELLPILRDLDATEAEKLLNDSQQTQAQLQKFPNGMQSLDPTIRDAPIKKGEASGISSASVGMQSQMDPMLQRQQTVEAYNSRIAEIARLAEDNPRQAIARATTLPASDGSTAPRSGALLNIARISLKKNPSASREALEQMLDSLKSVDIYSQGDEIGTQHEYWAEGIHIAMQLGEVGLAKSLLKAGIDQAEKLESKDLDDSDPNRALKAWWPSVAFISRLISAAAGISPQTALNAIAELSDPEVRLLCQVRLVNDRLGVPGGESTVMVRKKSSNAYQPSRVGSEARDNRLMSRAYCIS
jgi:hypothetical protein